MVRLVTLALLAVAACGNIGRNQNQYDAAVPHDAASDSLDAPADAVPLKEAREVVSGGTRMTGATYTFDVQVGHGVQQSKITGPTYKLEGNAAVKP